MKIDHPILFIEINDKNYIFVAGTYDENQNLKVTEKIIAPNTGIDKNKFVSIDNANEEIKRNIGIIEKKLNYVFKDVNVIIENFTTSCVNISGFKKLNSSRYCNPLINALYSASLFVASSRYSEKE